MTLNICTVVLDGLPFITRHLAQFEKLSIPWRWVIVEGAAMNVGCTGWCAQQEPRLSRDGTTEYLNSLKWHPNIVVIQKESWPGKLAMFHAALDAMSDAGVLLEADSDEMWSTEQLETIVRMFMEHPYAGAMEFYCRYFVGPDIITVGENCFGNNLSYEWRRAWRYFPGQKFSRHEPPEFPHGGAVLSHAVTRNAGLVFDHFAYATEKQVAYKEMFYSYPGAVEGWKCLQKQKNFPVLLRDFLPWVDDRALATRIPLDSLPKT